MCGEKAQRKGDLVGGMTFEGEKGDFWVGKLEVGPVTLTDGVAFTSGGGPCRFIQKNDDLG